jgi:hypothetical protein
MITGLYPIAGKLFCKHHGGIGGTGNRKDTDT